jgi:hypothetical protein
MQLLKSLSKVAQIARTGLANQERGARRLLGDALRKRRPSALFNPTPASVKVYRAVIANKVALIDRLPTKYRKAATDVVWNSVMKGYDEAGLAKDLHEQFGITAERAARIAVCQCNIARSVIEHAMLIETGEKGAVWQYEESRCTVKGHKALAGRRYLLVGGALIDGKRVWPGSEPMCLCTFTRIDATPEKDD